MASSLVAAAHERCLDIHPYTVNDPTAMTNLITLGVDGMFTNFPDRLNAVLGRAQAQGKQGAKNAAVAHRECLSGSRGIME